ncbi:MAG: four helix bundle protein [Candidatus Peregrinibacteria bacterium]|nr:four helix bundle protein [Candidatus Peregrinibacteria bacterium]
MQKEGPLQKKSYAFALHVAQCSLQIQKQHREFVLTKQCLRSGTSIGANDQWYEPQSKLWTPFSGASSGESDHRLRKQVYFLQAARPA